MHFNNKMWFGLCAAETFSTTHDGSAVRVIEAADHYNILYYIL